MHNKTVSIIVPIYNLEAFLLACVNSILEQTYEDLEILLINDGSTDNSGKICDELANKNDNLFVIHKSNEGSSSARNTGLDIAKGEYIAFVDGDDTLPTDFIQQAVSCSEKYNLDLAIGAMRFIYPNTSYSDFAINLPQNESIKIYEQNIDDFINNMLTGNVTNNTQELANCVHCGPCARVYRHCVIKNIRFKTNLFLSEDLIFNFEALTNSRKIGVYKNIWYNYIQHSTSITKIAKKEAIQNFINVEEYAEHFNIQTNNKYKAAWDSEVLSQFSYALQRGIISNQLGYTFAEKRKHLISLVNDEKLRHYVKNINFNSLQAKRKVLFLIFRFKLITAGILITKLFVKLSSRKNEMLKEE